MNEVKLKPCPFCGGEAVLYGQEIRDFANVEWAKESRNEYWVRTQCKILCIYGITAGRAFKLCDGIHFRTPEAAIKAWNRRTAANPSEIAANTPKSSENNSGE